MKNESKGKWLRKRNYCFVWPP